MTDKEQARLLAKNDEEYLLLSRVLDKARLRDTKQIPSHSPFLSAAEQTLALRLLEALKIDHRLEGGFDEAQRRLLIFLPDYPVDTMPLAFMRAEKSPQDKLAHGDYLGSLMGLGLKREQIGDILVHENGADIVVLRDILDFLLLEYGKAGRKSLSVYEIDSDTLEKDTGDFRILRQSLSSLRLDLVAATAFGLSRRESGQLIEKGRILLGGLACDKADRLVKVGETLSLRGKGKAQLLALVGSSKKGKTVVEIKKYGG